MALRWPHIHRWSERADWGIDADCRCGLRKRRMMGGFGYALSGGLWLDTSNVAKHRELLPVEPCICGHRSDEHGWTAEHKACLLCDCYHFRTASNVYASR